MKKRILSGMRPTGRLHLGHYFGALKNWVALQNDFECFYFVADWHVLTDHQEKLGSLSEFTRELVIDYLAAGLDPARSTIFVQSEIPEHLELAWIFGSLSPIGDLERCPTYKDVVDQMGSRESPNYALMGYPVLQTADIALYRAHFVPVGEDQVSHLEISREIVRRFNRIYGEVFPEPHPKLTDVPRLAGLDGQKKMSKSLGNVIELCEPPDSIRKRTAAMFTDPARKRKTDPGHPDICNVYTFHKLFNTPDAVKKVFDECTTAARGCTDCKAEMAEKLVAWLAPYQERRRAIAADPKKVDALIAEGTARARAVARETMALVKKAMFQ